MKFFLTCQTLFLIILLFGNISPSQAQKKTLSLIKITKAEFRKHQPANYQIEKPTRNLKVKGKIVIKTPVKTIVFRDDEADSTFVEYNYEGTLKGMPLLVIHKIEYNTEEYYLINKQTSKIDTLFDKPIFFSNSKNFICLEGAATDTKQRIQIGSITNDALVKKRLINLPAALIPNSIYWSVDKAIVIEDSRSKFHKLIL